MAESPSCVICTAAVVYDAPQQFCCKYPWYPSSATEMFLLTKSMVVLPCLFCCCLLFHSWSVENEEKKNKKVERVGILLWCETLIYSTWGRQTLALACISSLFLLHATVFSFFLSGGKRVTVSIIFRMSVVLCLCVNSLSLW